MKKQDVAAYAEGILSTNNFDWIQNLRFGWVVIEKYEKSWKKTVKKLNIWLFRGHNFWLQKNLGEIA